MQDVLANETMVLDIGIWGRSLGSRTLDPDATDIKTRISHEMLWYLSGPCSALTYLLHFNLTECGEARLHHT